MIIVDSVIETIIYVLHKVKQADKIKIIKLVYLADKYHLAKYGRTITGDDYYAMKHGPVGSVTKDVLGVNSLALSEKSLRKINDAINQIDDYTFSIKSINKNLHFNALSESDIEVLDFVITKFGSKDSNQLSKYTHQYPEWYQYKELLECKQIKRERIETKELLSKIKNDRLLDSIPDDHIEQTRECLEGKF